MKKEYEIIFKSWWLSALVHKHGDVFFEKWIPAFAGMTLRPPCHSGESRNPEIV
jgi:hypothetical protein